MSLPNSRIAFGKDLQDDLFSEVARAKAEEIFDAGLDQRRKQVRNKSTQLRKFYDELSMWNDKVNSGIKIEPGKTSSEVRAGRYRQSAPFIKMLIAKVAYGRERGHVDESFEEMFKHCIKVIGDAESLKHAKLFMEAFVGFYPTQEK